MNDCSITKTAVQDKCFLLIVFILTSFLSYVVIKQKAAKIDQNNFDSMLKIFLSLLWTQTNWSFHFSHGFVLYSKYWGKVLKSIPAKWSIESNGHKIIFSSQWWKPLFYLITLWARNEHVFMVYFFLMRTRAPLFKKISNHCFFK